MRVKAICKDRRKEITAVWHLVAVERCLLKKEFTTKEVEQEVE